MKRSPFYPYPSAYPFRSPPAHFNLYPHDPPHHPFFPLHPSSPPTSSTSSEISRPSVINIPVFDGSASCGVPSPSLEKKKALNAAPLGLNPVSAATCIQSCFRGYFIRRHHPLTQLRSISASRKLLEGLNSELQSPEFSTKVLSNEKERLRFSESIMAVILRLDSIEGFIPEVRIRRKEATKIAIKLQDAVDAIMSLQEGTDSKPAVRAVAMECEATPYSDGNAPQEITPCMQGDEVDPLGVTIKIQEANATIQEEGPDQDVKTVEKAEEEEDGNAVQDGLVAQAMEEELIEAANIADLHVSHDGGTFAPEDEFMNFVKNGMPCRQATLGGIGVDNAGISGTSIAMVGEAIAPCKQADQTMQDTRCMMIDGNSGTANSLSENNDTITDKSYKSDDVSGEYVEELQRHGSILSPGTPLTKDRLDVTISNINNRTPMVEGQS